jgi:hypothetical protein
MDWNAGMPGRLWRRHINPWNWWSQVFGLVLLALGLWLRNAGLLVLAALVLLASSLLDFQLPPMRGLGLNALENLAARAIRWEHAWLLRPWDRKKTLWACGAAAAALLTGVMLWTQDLALLLAGVGLVCLVRVALENKRNGIDP